MVTLTQEREDEMTHKVEYEDIKGYVDVAEIILASSAGPKGTKRLSKVGERFVVRLGKQTTHEFGDLLDAVEAYNNFIEQP